MRSLRKNVKFRLCSCCIGKVIGSFWKRLLFTLRALIQAVLNSEAGMLQSACGSGTLYVGSVFTRIAIRTPSHGVANLRKAHNTLEKFERSSQNVGKGSGNCPMRKNSLWTFA